MTYLFPILYLIVSYTFFLLAGCFDNRITLQFLSFLLPFIMGVVNLIVVLTVGRKWSRKTLLNCTLIIKYGLIPFYLIGGCATIFVTLMASFGLFTVFFLMFGYGILFGTAVLVVALFSKMRRYVFGSDQNILVLNQILNQEQLETLLDGECFERVEFEDEGMNQYLEIYQSQNWMLIGGK